MTDAMTSNNLPALDALADKINVEHAACHSAMQKGLGHAMEAGRLLLEAKAGLAHGEWLSWLKGHCPEIGQRTAQNYMRLASEMPKLGPANAKRVADLSYRDAIRVISRDTSGIAGAEPKDRAAIMEAMETCGSLVEARRQVRQNVDVAHVPSVLKPEPGKRRVGVLANGEKREVCVVIGPNQAGLDLKRNLQAAGEEKDTPAWEEMIAGKMQRAKELREEAAQLEAAAKDIQRELDYRLQVYLDGQHGPALHYVETWDYALDDEQWGALQNKQRPDEAAAYVAEIGCLNKRGWWGDMRLGQFSANGPDQPGGGVGPYFNAWGGSDWLAEFFPDGLAPEDIRSGP